MIATIAWNSWLDSEEFAVEVQRLAARDEARSGEDRPEEEDRRTGDGGEETQIELQSETPTFVH
jgi:hypothetical protein